MTLQMVRDTFAGPAVAPLPGTLLATVQPVEGLTWLEPESLYESYNCLAMDAIPVWPCPAAFLAAPVIGATSTATTGGTLAADTYRAKVTAINGRGETTVSAQASRVTTGTTSTVTFNWAAVTGATGYRVYLTDGVTDSEDRYIEVGAVTSYILTDWPPTGQVLTLPPTVNTATVQVTKDLTQAPHWEDGFRFSVYGGFTCKAPGMGGDTETRLRAAFEMRESVGVERAFMVNRFVDGGTFEWSAPTDLTPVPGTAVDLAVALALLEGDAAANYAGQPTIHMPRTIGTLMSCCLLDVRGDKFYTKQGAKVVSGGGYVDPNTGPAGTAPPAGSMWMFASGEVQLARGELFVRTEMNRATNEVTTLLERVYMGTVDCYTSAVLVKVASE